jgi:hypothetical protein
MEAFQAIRPLMPWQEAYAFLLVALEEGRGVQEYAKGKALTHEITRLVRSDRPRANKLRPMTNRPPRDLVRDQRLSRLIAAGHKLNADDVQLAGRQLELLIDHRQSGCRRLLALSRRNGRAD